MGCGVKMALCAQAPLCTAPHRAAPHRAAPRRTTTHHTALHRTAPHRTTPDHTPPHLTAPCRNNPVGVHPSQIIAYRQYDGHASNALEAALRARAQCGPWEIRATENGRVQIYVRPSAAGHRAAGHLRNGRRDDSSAIGVTWRITTDVDSSTSTGNFRAFSVPTSKEFDQAPQPLLLDATDPETGEKYSLYPRQKQALKRMQSIEVGLDMGSGPSSCSPHTVCAPPPPAAFLCTHPQPNSTHALAR